MDERVSEPQPRLNPFAFPSDTDLRFGLLMIATASVSLFMYYGLYFRVSSDLTQTARSCWETTQTLLPDDTRGQVDFWQSCVAGANVRLGLWLGGGVAIVLLVAAGLYWLAPVWKIRHDRLEELTEEDDPDLVATVGELAREAGLKRAPTILTNADMTPSGLAFGRFGRYFLVLNAGLVMQALIDPAAFRTVVRHELAHLRNGDVDKTYFSLAIGLSFLVAAVMPYGVGIALAPGSLVDLLNVAWRTLVVVGLVYGSILGILRARELYADVRASTWDGPEGALSRVLASLTPARARLRGLHLHPSPTERAQAVEDPRHLLRFGFGDAVAVGTVATMAYPDVTLALGFLTSGQGTLFFYGQFASGVLFGALVVGLVGTGVWRSAFASLSDDRWRPNLNGQALGVATGMMLGLQLSLTGSIQHAQTAVLGPSIAITLAFGGAAFVSLRLFLMGIAAGARAWLAASLTHRSPRRAYLVGLSITSVLVGLWFAALLVAHSYVVSAVTNETEMPLRDAVQSGLAFGLGILTNPLFLAGLLALWAFPAAAHFWRPTGQHSDQPRWFWLEPSARPFPREVPAPRLRRTIASGVVGALVLGAVPLVGGPAMHLVRTSPAFCPPASVSLTPSTLTYGDEAELRVRGFAADASVLVTISGPASTDTATIDVDRSGGTSATVSASPTDEPGAYTVRVSGAGCAGGPVDATASYTLA